MSHALRGRTRYPGAVNPTLMGSAIPSGVPGCILWWAADSLSLDDDDPIAAITDQSAVGNDGNSDETPIYKVNIINGKPVMRFAGNQYMAMGSTITETAGMWFMVWKRANAANNDYVLGYNGENYNYLQYGGDWYVEAGSNLAIAQPATNFYLKACSYDGSSYYRRYTNAVAETEQAGAGGLYLSGLGNYGFTLDGDVAELFIFDNVLSQNNRQLMEMYVNAKYSLW